MTALFEMGSKTAKILMDEGNCLLEFEQFSQRYRVICTVEELPDTDPFWQATYWHNRLFNSALPANVTILKLSPHWDSARADPAP